MDQKILREYLLSLGFKVDNASYKKFDAALGGMDKRVVAVGKGLVGIAAAAQGMVLAFSTSMEKAYYASKLGQSTVANMNSAAFAGRQIGLTADQIKGSIVNMSMAMRANPGLQAFLESFGVAVQGRDMSDVLRDMVAAFGKMDPYLGMQFAEMFGMDGQTFMLMREGLEEYTKAQEQRAAMARKAGVDEDAAAEAAKRYMNVIRQLTEKVELLGKKLSISLLPHFERFASLVDGVLDKWLKLSNKSFKELMDTPYPKDPRLQNWVVEKVDELREWMLPEHKRKWKPGQAGGGRGFVNPALANPATPASFSALEAKYGLPEGLLDRMWAKESGRGRYMQSPKGAKGHFGFMDPTAKEWGVDPMDLNSSADGAARYVAHLMKRYGGDLTKALAAYNWGMGNVDSYGLGGMPAETRDYVKMGQGLTAYGPQTNIYINGADDPRATAEQVASRLEQRDRDYVRNLSSVVE